ncbi:aminoacyl-tRNA hydrolase [Sediminispirochaeta smaragdinae]|uniref:Peptidyl-tRNA hydrolase n=1 Tax=Sediminispirochaeta smaragdinae (strain DSM 11293 / JCM 15392 / SEBR 4228) TaxID=573413 RepID=E1R6C3_SEDSS|nr:aminoacyl-tRNA hydrolase [Sediminispirochaeta smaragdinae]ADK80941.1 peptidyl-tRNA hydrolase [Sediminispirochaeta smaragdinae DSM 11293]
MIHQLCIGLGNPGPQYRETRHNVGFLVLEALAKEFGVEWRKPFFSPYRFARHRHSNAMLFLVQPLTFMNRSGDVLSAILKKSGASSESMFLVCDNLDLAPGQVRIRMGGSDAGHNGLKSVIAAAGTGEFLRIYVGIGRPKGGTIVDHVLGIPSEGEEQEAVDAGIARAAEAVTQLVEGEELQSVMNRFNRRNRENGH